MMNENELTTIKEECGDDPFDLLTMPIVLYNDYINSISNEEKTKLLKKTYNILNNKDTAIRAVVKLHPDIFLSNKNQKITLDLKDFLTAWDDRHDA